MATSVTAFITDNSATAALDTHDSTTLPLSLSDHSCFVYIHFTQRYFRIQSYMSLSVTFVRTFQEGDGTITQDTQALVTTALQDRTRQRHETDAYVAKELAENSHRVAQKQPNYWPLRDIQLATALLRVNSRNADRF